MVDSLIACPAVAKRRRVDRVYEGGFIRISLESFLNPPSAGLYLYLNLTLVKVDLMAGWNCLPTVAPSTAGLAKVGVPP